ncbi:hypothetical protein ABZ867_12785 [Streptomyces cinnamoneus]
MTPAEELKAAAAKLAVLAKEATPGPWDSMSHGHMEEGCRCLSCHETSGWLFTHTKVCEETELAERNKYARDCEVDVMSFEDAEYAITVHPGVGAALAELLDYHARLADAATAAGKVVWTDDADSDACDRWVATQQDTPALAVARALLGTTDGSSR